MRTDLLSMLRCPRCRAEHGCDRAVEPETAPHRPATKPRSPA